MTTAFVRSGQVAYFGRPALYAGLPLLAIVLLPEVYRGKDFAPCCEDKEVAAGDEWRPSSIPVPWWKFMFVLQEVRALLNAIKTVR